MQGLWIFFAVLTTICVLLIGLAYVCFHLTFGKRCEENPRLRYFSHSDFEDLQLFPIQFRSDKGQLLRGGIYQKSGETPDRLVIFVHGMGGGHRSYMTEINTLASAGFSVMAYDNTGTCTSEGKSLVGFYQAVRDLRYALDFSRSLGRKIYLAGHSWGAYAVCQALSFADRKVSGVVAFSAPDSIPRLMCDNVRSIVGIPCGWMRPFFAAALFLSGGKNVVRRTSKVLADSQTPVLLLHGSEDAVVSFSNSPIARQMLTDQENITCRCYPGRAHNVYQTRESERYLNETFAKIAAARKAYGKREIPEAELRRLYDIDYQKITEEDTDVMKTVLDFLISC